MMRRLRLAAAMVVAASVPAPAQAPAAGDDPVAGWFRRVLAAQKDLHAARAACEVHTMFPSVDSTKVEEGTVLWTRGPDGSARQRWDLTETDDEGKPLQTTILVLGEEIVYVRDGRIEERGRLHDPGIVHVPALASPIFEVPPEPLAKDPVLEFHLPPSPAKDGPEAEGKGGVDAPEVAFPAGAAPVPPPGTPPDVRVGEDAGSADVGAVLFLRPRKEPWLGLLKEGMLVFDPSGQWIRQAEIQLANRGQIVVHFRKFEANPVVAEASFRIPADLPR